MHFRELCPKDFYLAQILRDKKETPISLLFRLILNHEALDNYSIAQTQKMFDWAMTNLFEEKVMSVENWLEIAFHLCKQRWDNSIDWLEMQPISKILAMIDIVEKFNKAQQDAIKKTGKK